MPITIGSIPIRDNFEASAVNPGMVTLGQPMPSQNQFGEAAPMLPPTQPSMPMPMPMKMTMPPLPNQNGNGTYPYPSGPSAPFPSVPPPNEKGVPGAPPSAPPNAFAPNAPSAPDFSESKTNIFAFS